VHFSLPAGSLLFESGSPPDGVYLVASGRLGVKTPGNARLTAEIGRGELVGEAGYEYARRALESLPAVPRLAPAAGDRTSRSSLVAELERRLAASIEAG
jgi:CRP-like cAMP-binding protein